MPPPPGNQVIPRPQLCGEGQPGGPGMPPPPGGPGMPPGVAQSMYGMNQPM